jgi:predicted RNA-binding Zn-ribbon protein involved in translation (DUF1610 family)
MDYIDMKYLNLLSAQLEKFKDKGNGTYNFRCPYCGDSTSNKNKARGYIFQKEGKPFFKCHNCGKGALLRSLLRHINPQLHSEYSLERFSDGDRGIKKKKIPSSTKTSFRFKKRPNYLKTPLGKLKKVSQLAVNHPVKKYVEGRKIPKRFHYKLFYTPKFNAFAHQFSPENFDIVDKDEPRLILPFINREEELIGFQGRALGKSSLRYITVKVDENAPKIFGLDTVDITKPVYVVEGPIDSLFLNNSIAMGGADVSETSLKELGAEEVVFVFDNEPRNKEILNRIGKIIELGYSISLFPDYVGEKDINDMILAGRDIDEVRSVISNNTFSGLSAKAKLSEWRKV